MFLLHVRLYSLQIKPLPIYGPVFGFICNAYIFPPYRFLTLMKTTWTCNYTRNAREKLLVIILFSTIILHVTAPYFRNNCTIMIINLLRCQRITLAGIFLHLLKSLNEILWVIRLLRNINNSIHFFFHQKSIVLTSSILNYLIFSSTNVMFI